MIALECSWHRRRGLVLAIHLTLLVGCSAEAGIDRARLPQGRELLLVAREGELFPAPTGTDGVHLNSDTSLVVWSNNTIEARSTSGYLKQAYRVPDHLRIRGAFQSGKAISLLVTRGRDIGVVASHEERVNPLWVRVNKPDSLVAASTLNDRWWFATLDSTRVQVFRIEGSSSRILTTIPVRGVHALMGKSNRPIDVRLSVSATGFLIAIMSDSLRLYCEAKPELKWVRSRAAGSRERLLSALSLEDSYLLTTAQDDSPQRSASVVDSTCMIARTTPLPELMVPIGATSRSVMFADFRQQRLLRMFSWEWADPQPTKEVP